MTQETLRKHSYLFRATTRRAALVLLSLSVASCGGMEWSAPGYGNQGQTSGAVKITSQNAAFVNATAVIVGQGDTVYALSRRHQVSERDIIIANNLKAPYHLIVGQRIVLPRGKEHTVVKGDTLYALSRAYNVNVYDLARANGIKSPYTIFVGQKLRIPGTGTVVAAITTPPVQSIPSNSSGSTTAKSTVAPTLQAPTPAKASAAVPAPPPSTGKGFVWPVRGKVVSNFGAKEKGLHNDGINIAAPAGSPVHAAENGVVAYAGNELRGFGNLLLIKHANGYVTAYAHNGNLLVQRGDKVEKGQPVATVGSTGSVTQPQLHFELRKGKKALDPRKVMPPLSA